MEEENDQNSLDYHIVNDDGGNVVLRVDNGGNCSKGDKHKVIHKNGANCCEYCGLVFNEDIMFQHD